MNLEFFILGGYGQFVWPAFVFSFVSCAVFFIKAKKELQKQEKIYLNKYGKFNMIKTQTTKKNKTSKEILSGSLV